MSPKLSEMDLMAPPVVETWQRRAMIIGILGVIGAIIGWVIEPDYFYRAYLLGYMWLLEVTLGSMAMVMLYHLTGGAWGTVLRRILEAAMSNIWLMMVLFIPVVIGVHHLYPWSRQDVLNSDADIRRIAAAYLSLRFWIFRAVLYFIGFGALIATLNKVSRRQDRPPEVNMDIRLRRISGPGEVFWLFATFFMYVDWIMSITPHYISMVLPLIFNAGQGLTTICFAVIIAAMLVQRAPMKGIIKPDQFLDHGKIVLTFTMVWAWWTYGQWIIFWSGNKPDEIGWFLTRTHGGWNYWGFVIILGHFFIPFLLLLSRSFKSNFRTLRWLALWLLFARYMDILYYIMPNYPDWREKFHYSWLFAVVPIAFWGVWLTAFFWHLKRRPLLAVEDAHAKILVEEGHEYEQAV